MANRDLSGKRIAVLATNGFEESELVQPVEALRSAGAHVDIVAPEDGEIRAWAKTDWGKSVKVDKAVDQVRADDYDALVLPGGVMSPDKLRMNEKAVAFTRAFFEQHKPVSAICHGPWTLIDAGVVGGRKVTSYPSLKADLRNAGATWVDEEVVVDQGLVTSRNPGDLPAFIDKTIEEVLEGKHAGQTA